jgi:uncharacterized protein YutE (UPF0331/DUF86 family)
MMKPIFVLSALLRKRRISDRGMYTKHGTVLLKHLVGKPAEKEHFKNLLKCRRVIITIYNKIQDLRRV